MYTPIMKNRTQEMKVLKDFQYCFDESIVPLIEIITDKYEKRYKTDPKTGRYLMEKPDGNRRRQKIELPKTEEDIITLSEISGILQEKKAFIDFFRFTDEEYKGVNYDVSKVELSFTLSRDNKLYHKRMLELGQFPNLIPTISIKDGFEPSLRNLTNFIDELRKQNGSIAIRITDDLLERYSSLLTNQLTDQDFIMLDIRQQNFEAMFMELQEFKQLQCHARKIVLNSPRLRELYNGEYENLVFTQKINNICATKFNSYKFDGFGDFAGYKDTLPSKGSDGTGCALALIYCKTKNQFFSVVNKNSSLGMKGYNSVVDDLLNNRATIDPNFDCPILTKINSEANKTKYGNWGTWNYYIIGRYIHQQATK